MSRRTWRWLWVAAAAGTLGVGLRLRVRASKLPVLTGTEPAEGTTLGALPESGSELRDDDASLPDGWELRTAPGCRVDEATRRALRGHAEANQLDVIDVVPRRLGVDQALDLLRRLDPATYRSRPLVPAESALQAVLTSPAVATRGVSGDIALTDPVSFLGTAVRLKRHFARSTDVVVASSVEPAPFDQAKRRAYLQRRFGQVWPLFLYQPWVGFAFLAAGLVLFPPYGLLALAAWCLQPAVALAGTALRPDDLWRRSLLRAVLGPVDHARAVVGRWEVPEGASDIAPMTQRRAEYTALLAEGTDAFFEPRRDTCPMCASPELAARVQVGDLFQNKPGRFTVEECRACSHLFQNPRLNLRGLDFYYRDFYDGAQAEEMDWALGASTRHYHDRSQFVVGSASPSRWIDIGTGQGHFCEFAKEEWPDTAFEGLDIAETIEEAERRGWVERGHRGQLIDLAPSLEGRYDVVSMFHYLEHTREPLDELDAALRLLAPGGVMVVELPDPESAFARMLGRYWLPWFQPQHQHFLSLGRLSAALEARGLEIVKVERGRAHGRFEFFGAWYQLLHRVAPPVDAPWRQPMGLAARTGRAGVFAAMLPLGAAALVGDALSAPVVIRTGRGSDAFRVLARRYSSPGQVP